MTSLHVNLSGVWIFICSLMFLFPSLSQSDSVPQPAGYRTELYDDIVPDGLIGATTVEAEQVAELRKSQKAIIVDVIPEQRRPDNLPKNQIWIPVEHRGLPGALWLPEVGYGALSNTTENYFKHHLSLATHNNLAHPLVFYCRDNCWMSWNAAKRALTYGYTNIYWFTEGTEGWFDAGFDFELLQPAPGKRVE